jgi:hypothetical protein
MEDRKGRGGKRGKERLKRWTNERWEVGRRSQMMKSLRRQCSDDADEVTILDAEKHNGSP